MKIDELFSRDIHRRIEEVVKVDLGGDEVLERELDEYVATAHLLDEFEEVIEAYQETVNSPNETCTIWVSGFFGSGKSSWAKILGYLLANPVVGGRRAADRFFERAEAPRLRALLNSVHAQAPTRSILLNLATGSNVVARDGESVILPVYRALLTEFGYSRDILLAELEYALESDGLLGQFEQTFAEVNPGRTWQGRRYTSLAKNEASRVLHTMDPATYSQPDSWARTATEPAIDADWLVARAQELLARRGNAASRLIFIVDEAGQYVARSVERMLDLQGLAEACQKVTGRVWLAVTSQERLNDVIDSLESRRVELARAQARFPLRVDLLPSDINEVAEKRVLDKTADGQRAVREAVSAHRNQLATATRLASPTRSAEPSEDDLVRLYPLVPYQVQLLIDAVSARRVHGGASPTVGGSNRTIIKHAQQLITHPRHGLAGQEVGVLVTIDRSYDLLEELIPTSWRAEVEQVGDQYGSDSVEVKVMKAVALCADVPALALTEANLAVLLHPGIAAEWVRAEVVAAVQQLVMDDRLRAGDGGYRLQSPEQKDWEQARRSIGLTEGIARRERRTLLKQGLTGLAVTAGRTFKVTVTVDGEPVLPDGDLDLHIEEADPARRDLLRSASREAANSDRVTWVYGLSADAWNALHEVHRSKEMILRRDTPAKSAADVELLGEERARQGRAERAALTALTQDLAGGQVIFRGRIDDVQGSDLKAMAQRMTASHVTDIYPRLPEFNASVRREDALTMLRTPDLGTVASKLLEDGIGLVRATPRGYELTTSTGPLAALVDEIRARTSYGQEPTGDWLERKFSGPPFGASVELIEVLCAAGIRAGLIEVIHQGQAIRSPGDARLDQVFQTLPRFRAAAFRPPADTDVPLDKRVALAEKLEGAGHQPAGHSTEALAAAVRSAFLPSQAPAISVESAFNGLGLSVPGPVTRTKALLNRLSNGEDADVVTTAHDTWADLYAGRQAIARLEGIVRDRLEDLRAAQREARRPATSLSPELAAEHAVLVNLLAADDMIDHLARVTAITSRLGQARDAATRDAARRLESAIQVEITRIHDEFGSDQAVNEAIRPLQELAPTNDLDGVDAAALESRIDSARARAGSAARQLTELRSVGQVAWIRVADLAPEPITEEAEIKPVLDRIREAIARQLADEKVVKLQ